MHILNDTEPDFIRLRTFVPKINTPLLAQVKDGAFQMLGPHEVLAETARLISAITARSSLTSDHYTNYINLEGKLPDDKPELLARIQAAGQQEESNFRPFLVGTQ